MTACQRWRDGQHSWRRPEDGGFDKTRYEVAPIDDDSTAKTFVVQHHYSGTYPAARLRYGLFDRAAGGELVGVAVLSVPSNEKVLTKVFPGLAPYDEALELGRFVLLNEVAANAETWFLGAIRHDAAKTGLRGVVSFSDPVPRYDERGNQTMPGHQGTIYRADNFRRIGEGTRRTLRRLPNGQVFSARAMQKIRAQERGHEYAEQMLIRHGARVIRAGEDPRAWLREVLGEVTEPFTHPGNLRFAIAAGETKSQRRAVRIVNPDTGELVAA